MASKGAKNRKDKKAERKAKKAARVREQLGVQPEPEILEAAKAGPPRLERRDLVLAGDPHQKDPNYRKVTVFPDHRLKYPELWMCVYVADKCCEPIFAEMFTRANCYKADNLAEADLVVFTGGPDVNPELYGELPHSKTQFSKERDDIDTKLFVECLKKGIPMLGVCRGAQFLHVMNGGKLWQDVDGHGTSHSMRIFGSNEVIDRVSSTHHQMVRPHHGMEVLGVAEEATEKWATPTLVQRQKSVDIEAFFYRDTCCFGVQGHPEYKSYNRFTQWVLEQIERLVCHNPDIEATSGVYRVKREFILERQGLEKGKK